MAIAESENPSFPLVESDEERGIRDAVRGICESFGGPDYHRRIIEADESPRELWDALAEKGYLGVNLPERYGGGGLGMHALQAVGEEISAAGCSLLLIVVSPAIVGSILARHGTDRQKEDWLPGHRRRHHPSRLRDHRARRRDELPQPLDLGHARPSRAATCCAGPRPTSPASRTPRRSSSSPASARTTARSAYRC